MSALRLIVTAALPFLIACGGLVDETAETGPGASGDRDVAAGTTKEDRAAGEPAQVDHGAGDPPASVGAGAAGASSGADTAGGSRAPSTCELATWPEVTAGGSLHGSTNAPAGSRRCALDGVWDVHASTSAHVGVIAFGSDGRWTSRADQSADLCAAKGNQTGTFGFDGDYLVFVGGSAAFDGCLQSGDAFVDLQFADDCASMIWLPASAECGARAGGFATSELRRKR